MVLYKQNKRTGVDKKYCLSIVILVAFSGAACRTSDTTPQTNEFLFSGPWLRHSIDPGTDTLRGADGVRLADVNDDGKMDVVTGWEQGNAIRAYLYPGPERAKQSWPAVSVGQVSDAEDAVFVDLDADGAVDVVSSTEGNTRSMYVHWAPKTKEEYLTASAWRTEVLPVTEKKHAWMFAVPMNVDGRNGIDLVVGSKGEEGVLGWLESPASPRDLSAWTFHKWRDMGWVMSIIPFDMDADGDLDVVFSDRKGINRGVFWMENPGYSAATEGEWIEHQVGGDEFEIMFITVDDVDSDGKTDILAATFNSVILYFRSGGEVADTWSMYTIENPYLVENGKAVRLTDVNMDGQLDIIHTANNHGDRTKQPVNWMSFNNNTFDAEWDIFPVSGSEGVKFDLIQLLDLDEDGDLDVVTCEEADNLGVIWYENPAQ